MVEINDKVNCCGCYACYNVCPKNAITMIEDEKGFKYPEIKKEKCISCGLCDKVCPLLNKMELKRNPKAYACYNKDENIRMQSTSGGIFTAIASAVIHKKGAVFGACFDDKFEVRHSYVETTNELKRFRSSKYVQSNINDTYKQAKKFLDDDRFVLFTGTPCQIEGLISYLKKDYDKLFLQDIICHGVPSPKAWELYKQYRGNKVNSKISEVSFRSKYNEGWSKYHFNMQFENGEIFDIRHDNDAYMKAFLKHLSLRKSCTDCKFKKMNRVSDITLADFWGINNIKPEFNDEKGVSLVIVNSEKGEKLFKEIQNDIVCKEVDFIEAIKENPSFSKTSEANEKSNIFWENVTSENFEEVTNKLIPRGSIIKKIIWKMKNVCKKIIQS